MCVIFPRAIRVRSLGLATIFIVSVVGMALAPPLAAVSRAQDTVQSAPQSAPADKPANPSEQAPSASQSETPAQTPAATKPNPPPSEPSAAGQNPAQPVHHAKRKKKAGASDCTSTDAAAGSPAGSTSGANSGETASGAASAPVNCPPHKIIVQQGGTKDPSIQVIGGPADQASHQRDTAKQTLSTTEANLKKIEGRRLNPNQQAVVAQIRQFMQQSRSAVEAGDLERADTLAKKAQMLSEELVKPEQ